MKRLRFSLAAFCLAVVLLFTGMLSGCGADSAAAVSYKGEKISCAMFQYLCSQKKTAYLYEAYGVDQSTISSSQLQDNPAIWQATAADGATVADTLKSEVLDEVKLFLYMSKYAADQGYVVGTEQKEIIKAEFDKVVRNYTDKKTFNREMKTYGVNYDILLEYNYLQAAAQWGIELLFGENGTQRISDETLQKYYKNNYATAGCIFINTKNKTYPNGKVVGLPEEEKQEKIKLADELFQKVQAGEDFAALAVKHSDQTVTEESAKKGYTFTKGGFVNAEAESKVFEMKVGEIARVETDGGIYILCKKALDADYFETAESAIRTELEDLKKYALVSEAEEKFKLDEDFLNELDIVSIPHLV